MDKPTTVQSTVTIGIDLGDRISQVCGLDSASRAVVDRFAVATTRLSLEKRFSQIPTCRAVIEAGTHSAWVSRSLTRLGHEVIVANPRMVRLISENRNKCDRVDAETLARWRRTFLARAPEVRRLGLDDRFIRTWEYYLCACEAAFSTRSTIDMQIVMEKPAGRARPFGVE